MSIIAVSAEGVTVIHDDPEEELRRRVEEVCDAKIGSDETKPFHHFDTRTLLGALNLSVLGGVPEIVNDRGESVCILSWSAEETIAYVVGRMLDPAVRKRVLEARVFG